MNKKNIIQYDDILDNQKRIELAYEWLFFIFRGIYLFYHIKNDKL